MEIHLGNPYELLSVGPHAGEAEITAAFRRLVAGVHPDRATDEEDRRARTEATARLTAAYRTLRDPEARADLDWELREAGGWRYRLAHTVAGLARLRPRGPRVAVPDFGAPLSGLPDFDPSAVVEGGRGLVGALIDTRLGQWLLMAATAGAIAAVGALAAPVVPSASFVLLGVVAALLSLRGAPSPAHDALAVVGGVADRLAGRVISSTSTAAAVAVSAGAKMHAEAQAAGGWRAYIATEEAKIAAEMEPEDGRGRRHRRDDRDDRDGPRDRREGADAARDERPWSERGRDDRGRDDRGRDERGRDERGRGDDERPWRDRGEDGRPGPAADDQRPWSEREVRFTDGEGNPVSFRVSGAPDPSRRRRP